MSFSHALRSGARLGCAVRPAAITEAQCRQPPLPQRRQQFKQRTTCIPISSIAAQDAGPQDYFDAAAAAREDDGEEEEEDVYLEHEELEEDFEYPYQQEAASPSPPAAIILAGFYVEELPGVRHLLDQAGGQAVKLVPCAPELLSRPLAAALQLPEPAWDEPVPAQWVDGGGWGRQRTVLFSGLPPAAQAAILETLEESQMGEVCAMVAGPDHAAQRLGDVLAAAVAAQRNRSKGIQFAEELLPLEAVPTPQAPELGAPAQLGLDDVDLDIIDRLAGGTSIAASTLAPAAPLAIEPLAAEPVALSPVGGGLSERAGSKRLPLTSESSPAGGNATPAATIEEDGSSQDDAWRGSGTGANDDATLPSPEDFILNQAQLRKLAEQAGLDYSVLLAGLQEKGIDLQG